MPSPTYNLWLKGSRVEDAVLSSLSRLEIRESDAEPSVAALRFGLSQRLDGELGPLDDDVFTPGAKLEIELTAPGGVGVRLFTGYVSHIRPHFEPVASNCFVEVIGMDPALLLDAEERAATYPDTTDMEAAEQVFGRYGIRFEGTQTGARNEADRQLLVQRGTDWAFVGMLARRNGFVCHLETDPGTGEVSAYFGPRLVDAEVQADLTILRDGVNLKWIDLQSVATGPVRVVGAAIDPIEKRVVRADGAPSLAPLGDRHLDAQIEDGLVAAGASVSRGLLRDPARSEAALAAQASGRTDEALFAIEARGELDPAAYRGLLRARRPVLVKGIGRTLAGAYFVQTVRTTVDEGVLSQTFVAQRNAGGLSGKEAFGKEAEEVAAR